jgi:hypothetical protein
MAALELPECLRAIEKTGIAQMASENEAQASIVR